MKLVNNAGLVNYLKEDWVADFLNTDKTHQSLTCGQWLQDSPPKRYIYSELYKNLDSQYSGRVLDIGGGLTAFSVHYARHFQYELVDLMHHDDSKQVEQFKKLMPENAVNVKDWAEFIPKKNYDIIISNDLFPNVDQRLADFIEKFMPVSREIRLSLTFYNNNIYYKVKRLGRKEILFIRPWDARRLVEELSPFKKYIKNVDFKLFEDLSPSVFANGRQICLLTIRGNG